MTEAELERHLRELYRMEDPPAGLSERIYARARDGWWQQHTRLLGACAALVVACAFVAFGLVLPWRQQQARLRQAQEAQAQLAYALQITSGELNWAENHITQDMQAGGKEARP